MLRPESPAENRLCGRCLRWLWAALPMLLLAVAAVSAADALGCPNCKDAVSDSDPEGMNLARGYFYSILIMLAMPFALIGSFSAYVWREMRRQKATAETTPGDSQA